MNEDIKRRFLKRLLSLKNETTKYFESHERKYLIRRELTMLYFCRSLPFMSYVPYPGENQMPRKNAVPSMTFVNVPLTGEQKKEFAKLWEKDIPQLNDMFVTCLEKGHTFKGSYDPKNDTFIVFTGTKDETNVNYGTGFSTRAGDPVQAMFLAAWKVTVVCGGGLWQNDDDFDFG